MKWLRLLVWLMLAAASGAQAQIAFRAAAEASVAVGGTGGITFIGAGASASRNNCGNVNPAIPGGNVDDVLIALVNARENGATVSMTGWNEAYGHIFPGGTEMQVKIYWRLANGSDPNTVTQSGTCSSIGAQIARFRNVDTTQPLETDPIPDLPNVQRQTNVNNVDTGTQATTVADSMLLVAAFIEDNRTVTQGAGWSQAFDSALNLTRDLGLSLHYRLEATTGTFSVSNWNHGGSVDNYGIMFALRPAGPASPLTINVPAGTATNDVMIASITVRPCSNTSGGACTTAITAPVGWTQVGMTIDQPSGAGTGGFGHRLAIYSRVAAGAEPASYTWSFGGTPLHAGAAGAILSFSGVDTGNPIIASAGQATTNAYTHAAPSINTSPETNAMLVSTHSANSSATWTPPAGMAERADIASLTPANDLGLSLQVNSEVFATAGVTGTRTATLSNPPASDTGATHMLALRPGIAHYSISASSTTVANCDYAEITVVGHNSTDSPATVPGSRTLTLSTSTGTGVWQATLVAGTGTWLPSGANNGGATYTWPGGESGFTVRLRQSAVTSLSINLSDGAATEGTGSEDPTISFVNSVFRISDGANAAQSIGTQIAGKPSNVGFGAQNLFLQAIRTDTTTGACVSLFPSGGDVSIDVAAQCNNPATCTQTLSITSNSPSGNSRTFVPGSGFGAMNFRFTTASAEAPFALNYGDAGQLTLEFRAALPSPPANQFVQGTSNAFVTRPFGLAFPGVTHGIDHTSGPLAAAGDNFPMSVAAYRWDALEDDGTGNPRTDISINLTDNGVTPNFSATTTVDVLPGSNAAGAANGTITRQSTGNGNIAAAEFTSGAAAVTDWRYSEVGNVTFTATSSSYLGSGVSVNGRSTMDGTGNRVGRFRPKHFAVSGVTLTNRADIPACGGGWSYMGEIFRLGFTLTAQNAQNLKTDNYTGNYAKLGLGSFANWSLGARSGTTNLTARLDGGILPTGTWSNGEANVTITTAIGRNTPDDPDGPFSSVSFGIAPSDGDTPTPVTMNTLDFDADNNSVNERKNLGVTNEVRFGRLRMDNAVGSERLPLPFQMEAQHWTGAATGFQRNTVDNCTGVARQNFSLGAYTRNLNACETIVSPASVTLSGGVATLSLSAPGAANDGTVLITLNLAPTPSGTRCDAVGGAGPAAVSAAMSYLLGRSNDAASAEVPDVAATRYDDNPSSRAAFGLFGGQPNNFIYFRENY